jgi:LysM repeat protein
MNERLFSMRTLLNPLFFQRHSMRVLGTAWFFTFVLGGEMLTAQTVYTVLPGDTFSRIARAYGLSITELHEANPNITAELNPGDHILIPQLPEPAPVHLPGTGGLWHTVEAGETLYSIGNVYQVPVQELERHNPAAASGLSIGDVLVIRPEVASEMKGALLDTADRLEAADSLPPQHSLPNLRTDTLRALIMLPFMLDADTVPGGDYDAKTRRLREISLEFLHGAEWAAAMLSDSGYAVSLRVMDTEPDSLGGYDWSESDLVWANVVLGPLRREPLDSVNSLLAASSTPQWVLTPQNPIVWDKHPLAFTLDPVAEIGMRRLGQQAAWAHPGDTVLLVETRGKDARMEQAFKVGFESARTTETVLKSIPANAQFCEGLIAELDTSKLNVIAVPAGKPAQSLIAYIQTELQLADSFPVQLYGNADTREFEFLERRFLERAHWTMPVSQGTRWSDAELTRQVQSYRDAYRTDPSLYALVACDALLESAKWQALPWPVPASVYYQPEWVWDPAKNRWMNHRWEIEKFDGGGWVQAQ